MIIVSEIRRRRKLPFILAAILLVIVLGGLVGYNLYDEYHTYKSGAVTEYETVEEVLGEYVLVTEKKELLGKTYAGFAVKDKITADVIYKCPDLYLVGELVSIGWKGEDGTIAVLLEDGSEVVYVLEKGDWEKQ